MSACTSLEVLVLTGNGLTKIPEGIKKLTNLRELDLSVNDLREVDAHVFKNMTGLTELNLSSNNIKSILRDEALENLQALEVLRLNGNRKLRRIPKSLLRLPNLRILTIDDEVKDPENIIEFLKQSGVRIFNSDVDEGGL